VRLSSSRDSLPLTFVIAFITFSSFLILLDFRKQLLRSLFGALSVYTPKFFHLSLPRRISNRVSRRAINNKFPLEALDVDAIEAAARLSSISPLNPSWSTKTSQFLQSLGFVVHAILLLRPRLLQARADFSLPVYPTDGRSSPEDGFNF
jgi:hypothetical protein